MVFVYVCLEVVDFSVMFASHNFIELLRYGVRDVYVMLWGLICCRWFLHLLVWFAIALSKYVICSLTFCIVILCLVQRI